MFFMSWPTRIFLSLVAIISYICAWYLGVAYANHECLKREHQMAMDANSALLAAHEQTVSISMQVADIARVVEKLKK